jgi:hypothetical protein
VKHVPDKRFERGQDTGIVIQNIYRRHHETKLPAV